MTNDQWSKEWPKPTPTHDPQRIENYKLSDEAVPSILDTKFPLWPTPTPNPTTDPEGFVKALEKSPAWPKLTMSNGSSITFKGSTGDPIKSLEWSDDVVKPQMQDAAIYGQGFSKDGEHIPLNNMIIGVDVATKPDRVTVCIGHVSDGQLIVDGFYEGDEALAKIAEYKNKEPVHDPYTNPNMHIYHQCDCGAILDPNTKSFAALNNAASYRGWKIRWGHDTYKAYCVECGKGVE